MGRCWLVEPQKNEEVVQEASGGIRSSIVVKRETGLVRQDWVVEAAWRRVIWVRRKPVHGQVQCGMRWYG